MFKRFALTVTGVLISMGQVYAIVYPTLTPTGETPGGAFQTYFDNMYTTTQCNTLGQVVGGFTSSGVPICQTPVASGLFFMGETSGDTIRFDGTNWIRTNFLYNNGTNIGIGNQSPTATLDVNGQIRIRGGSPGSGKLLMSDTTGIASWYDPLPSLSGSFWTVDGNIFNPAGSSKNLGTISNHPLPIITNNIERMRIDTSGNVGIGTATPGARLEVAGQVKITGGGVGSGKFLVSDATGLATWTDIVPATSFNISGSTLGDTLYYNGTDWVRTNNVFHTGGNVGIGTTTPGSKLEVNGQVKITGGSPGTGYVLTSDATGLASWQLPTVAGVNGGQSNYIARWLTNTTLGTGTIYDNGTNVGIGKTNPTRILDVNGDILINGHLLGRGNGNNSSNTAFGLDVLGQNTTGVGNTAIGQLALTLNTSGLWNTAIGSESLSSNTTGFANSALGQAALRFNTTGSFNTALGNWALEDNTTGRNNVAIGAGSLGSNTIGESNTAIGIGSLENNTSAWHNTAVGAYALNSNTTGDLNTALGGQALQSNTTGNNNTAIGNTALWNNTTGLSNVAVGPGGLSSNTVGSNNVSVGHNALRYNTVGNQNVAIGDSSLESNTGGSYNISIGRSLSYNRTGSGNIGIGYESLWANIAGNNNSALGLSSLFNVGGSNNVGLGYRAGYDSSLFLTGSSNTFLGYNTSYSNPNISNATAIGADVVLAQSNTVILGNNANVGVGTNMPLAKLDINGQIRITGGSPGSGKILTSDASGLATWVTGFSGSYTASGITGGTENYVPKFGTGGNGLILSQLFDSGTGVGIGTTNPAAKLDIVGGDAIINGIPIGRGSGAQDNIVIGSGSLFSNTIGLLNVSMGGDALFSNTTGQLNSAIGYSSLRSNTTGYGNSAIGVSSLRSNTTGYFNVAIGNNSLYANTVGNYNIASGLFSLRQNTSGSYNLAEGYYALYSNMTGSHNVAIGNSAGSNLTSGDANIFIGYNVQPNISNTASNQLNIGNWIYGDSGNIGIGTGTGLTARLSINGQIRITGGSPGSGKILTSDATGLAVWSTGFSGSVTSSGITGGTQHYVPKFGTGGNGLVLSQIYDTGTGVVIGATTLASKFEIWSGATSILHMRGTNNLGFGSAAVRTATSGSSNVGFGNNVLRTLTTGYSNTAMGVGAGYNTTTGFFNSAFGESALYSNSIGNWNSALGTQALWTNLDGSYNVAFGGQALYSNLNNDNSVAIGYQALRASTADNNIAIGYMAGSGITTGANNIIIGSNAAAISNTASNQLNIGNWIYGSNGNIGIGTGSNLTARLNVDSGVSGVTGLRLPRVNNNSPVFTGAAVGLGIDGSGNVVPVSNGDVVVYDALGRNSAAPVPDPDIAGRRIRYDFNKYFQLPTKQSFVVSNGNGAGFNAPYFKEDGVSGICSWNGASGTSPYDCAVADPVTGLSASPNNSFTMTARGDNYGYQLALGARGDAPLFARSGRWFGGGTNYGSGLYLADGTTPTPWQKVLTVPANHIEYFYVNIGYNSQLQEIAGGGNIGMGTSNPDMRLVLAYSGTTGSTREIMRIQRGVQGADANMVNAFGTPYLMIGGEEKRTGSIQTLGFGYTDAQSAQPAEIGLVTTNTAGNTQGDLVFATRNATTNTAPSERMRIFSNGNVTIGSTNNSAKLRVDGQVMIVDGSQGAGRVLTSDANGLATWQAPSGGGGGGSGAYTSVLTSAASRTSNVLGDLGLSSPYLPVGYYNFRFTARFRTAATTTGIGVALAANGATVTNYGGQFIAQTATNATQTYSDATLGSTTLLSTAVPAANTDYIATYQGVFQVTSAGAVKIQYRSEVNGSNVTIQPGSNLIIEPL